MAEEHRLLDQRGTFERNCQVGKERRLAMYTKRTTFSIFLMGLMMISLSACNGGSSYHPAAALQNTIAAQLADPGACPSGDSQDVQQIVDAAGPDGLARLPEGCYRMTSTVSLPPGIRLVGAGADRTILYREPGGHFSQPILRVSGGGNAVGGTQISGLALVGVRDTDDTGEDYGITLSSVQGFRVDHCYFEGFGFAAVRVEGVSSGVVDHAIFVDNFKRGIDNLGYGVVVYGNSRWDTDIQPVEGRATFVEDSLFVGNRHAIASNAGAYYVFRHNQVLHSVVACAVDAHGMGYGSSHGTRYVEIYRNVIEDPVYNWCGIGIRGGAGVIFENTIKGYKNPILLILEWGTPEGLKAEYPAFDQVQELYIWDNQIKGGPSKPRVDETGIGFIEAGRDYFTEPKPGYVPYVYPHPLARGGLFDAEPWPPLGK
jgi:hypothetical protein